VNLVDRVKNVLVAPAQTLPQIAAEPATVASLFQQYAIPLAAIPAVCSFIGTSLVGTFGFRTPLVAGVAVAVLTYVLSLISVYIVGLVVDALAPSFGAAKDPIAAMKTSIVGSIPAWVAGVFSILPLLGILRLVAGLYGIYLLYLGVQVFMRAPADKAVIYTLVTIVVAIVLFILIGLVVAPVTFMLGGMGTSFTRP
jgi:hypothetical protein